MGRTRGGARASVAAVVVGALASVAAVSTGAAGGAEAGGNDPGILSAEALAGANCDRDVGRIRFQYYGAPLCVKPWKAGADNGGATAQGVTADAIDVVVLWDELSDQQFASPGLYTNQATGQNERDAAVDATIDENEMFKHVYETWGREVKLEFVRSSGTDEAAQRADAVRVAELEPFAVIDAASLIGTPAVGGGPVFRQALEGKVPYVIPDSPDPKDSSRTYGQLAAELVGKQLQGGKAVHAGDELSGKARKFGVLHASNFDIDYFEQQLRKWDVTLASKASYPVPADQSAANAGSAGEIDQQMPTMIAKLKADGVTTLVMMANNTAAASATRQMKAQAWYPEIVETSFPYTDLDILARSFDQDVWSHAFGLVWFLPLVSEGYIEPIGQAFQWFWGTDQGTRWQGAFAQLGTLYSVIQYAGPDLDEASIDAIPRRLERAGAPAGVGGAYSDSVLTLEIPRSTSDDAVTPRGAALGWWDPDEVGPGNFNLGGDAAGKWMYLNDARRYTVGTVPKKVQPFFDAKASVPGFDTVPASEPTWPAYPCRGCPSAGDSDVVPAASQGGA
jgi:hypothetical protein